MTTPRNVKDQQILEAARLERDRFFSLCPDLLCIAGLDGQIRQVNPAWKALLGYELRDLASVRPLDLVHPEDRRSSAAEIQKLVAGGEVESFENRCLAKDGTYRWLLWSATLALDQHAIYAAARDVTERKRAEEALRESEERSRAIVDSSVDAILTTDEAGIIQSANPAVEQIFGYEHHELVGRDLKLLMPSQDREEHDRHLERYLRTGAARIIGRVREVLGVRKDGSKLPIELQVSEFHVLGRRFFAGTIRDLTRIREAEEAGHRQHEILQGLFDHIPVMIAFLDVEGRPFIVNREFERTLGWKLEETWEVDLLAELYPERATRKRFRASIAAAERRFAEMQTRAKDGHVIDALWAHLRLSDGTAIAIGQDISEGKKLELQLWQSQKLEAVGRLAGGIAHDFNNVLNVVMGYAELLARPLPAEAPERKKLGKILAAAERAASLTRQLLAFSRQQVLQPRVLEVGVVVNDVTAMLKRVLGEDVELVVNLAATGRVRADPGQVEQVLLNLAVNARDAMPTGGNLTVETADAELDDLYARVRPPALEGRYVMLAVSDSGEGMDAATQARIFEPFFTTKGKGKGTGLGLSTVYGIVKQSGGYVWVYSERGVGTTFKIYLPRVDEATEAPATARRQAAPAPATETILVVEDQEAACEMIVEILREEGYRVLAAGDGIQAQELLRRSPETIDLLLTDVVMPKMSGTDLARALAEGQPRMRVLYMSGYTDEVITHHGVLNPGVSFLQKPFTTAALADRVREALGRSA
jgi:PAS domain S-box-containing protein